MVKLTPEKKELYCKQIAEKKMTCQQAAKESGISIKTIWGLMDYYQILGEGCFLKSKNRHYSKEFKIEVVQSYLEGNLSQAQNDAKFKIPPRSTSNWLSQVKNGQLLKDSPKSDKYRLENETDSISYNEEKEKEKRERMEKMSIEEKITLIEECKNSSLTIKDFCRRNGLKYETFYSWIRKYDENGAAGLKDGRGRPKTPEKTDEAESLEQKVKRLEKELAQQKLINELLKKKNSYNPYQ